MFDYDTLRQYARNGNSLGSWNGRKVFACSTLDLVNKGSGAYYVLYDDDNKIVSRDGKCYYSYGVVTEDGSVNEYNSRRRYNVSKERVVEAYAEKYNSKSVPAAAVEVTYTPGYDMNERPIADVRTEIDVDAILKSAREITIDDLLAGFMEDVMNVAKG